MDDQITSKTQISSAPYYVLTNDTFMSSWGESKYRINTLIFPCETYEQAIIVSDNAKNRTDQAYVRIVSNKPRLHNENHYYQQKTIETYPHWYEKGYFKK